MVVLLLTALVAVGLWLTARQKESPAFAFEFTGETGFSVNFSPDGAKLCATVISNAQYKRLNTVRIYSLTGHSIIAEPQLQEFENPLNDLVGCAWNSDGSRVAIARSYSEGIDLLDSETWKTVKNLRAPGGIRLGSLDFDRDDNLYAVTRDYIHDSGDLPTTDKALMWRQPLSGDAVKPEALVPDGCPSKVFSASCVPITNGVCVAVSFEDACSTAIYHVLRESSGKSYAEHKFDVPAKRAWVRFSHDGRYLAVRAVKVSEGETQKLLLLRLDNGEVWNTAIIPTQVEPRWFDDTDRDNSYFYAMQTIDFSRDGRFVACRFDGCVNVFRTDDNAQVLNVSAHICSVALSADGQYLATCPFDEKRIVVYKVY